MKIEQSRIEPARLVGMPAMLLLRGAESSRCGLQPADRAGAVRDIYFSAVFQSGAGYSFPTPSATVMNKTGLPSNAYLVLPGTHGIFVRDVCARCGNTTRYSAADTRYELEATTRFMAAGTLKVLQ